MDKPLKPGKWLTKEVFNWSLFDFANSTFATIVVAFVYAIYFKKVVAGNEPVAAIPVLYGNEIRTGLVKLFRPRFSLYINL